MERRIFHQYLMANFIQSPTTTATATATATGKNGLPLELPFFLIPFFHKITFFKFINKAMFKCMGGKGGSALLPKN
jgi:hypothetical protein